ncbi:MAG: DUF2845 domain-containing protein [Gammaproteobacteria bacterium]|jgi:hypothetical protein|nr:DUF2845 domain-containing protein [Gammaproteobacteria bacterium]MBU1491719.1 DUF2845 domain-containing protein [Gammaproteobacteria bacterium]MBU2216202.1 DUF2845 domain-containing protein [Gammaproteobacteria bacterium]MBU2322489.1 DUF2845 domain-containing protein [Gammaproteobacteria bacterium]
MRIKRCLYLLALCLLASGAQASTMRCGSQLIGLGDRMFEVQRKCGEPAARDLIGYTLGPNERREAVIEEWVYGPSNGIYHYLRFEANRLTNISSERSR